LQLSTEEISRFSMTQMIPIPLEQPSTYSNGDFGDQLSRPIQYARIVRKYSNILYSFKCQMFRTDGWFV